jgi:subtilisin family serine protease
VKTVYSLGLALLLALTAGILGAQEQPAYVPGVLLVKAREGTDAAVISRVLTSHGVRSRRSLGRTAADIVNVPQRAEGVLRQSLEATGLFEYVEPDYVAVEAAVPNDPSYPSQWHLPKVAAPQAWNYTTGSTAITVALVDSGVDTTHPDFAGRLAPGWNFVNNSATIVDYTGHGTAVAGIVAAASNNSAGVAAINWKSKLMPLIVLDASGYAPYSRIASAIRWAADHGARVINVSIGGTSASYTLQAAVDYAWSKGAVVFAAAMNMARDMKYYPAACNNAFAVAATDGNDLRASFSNFGSWIKLAAPGVGILTTARGGGYSYVSGTSAASPLAAGVASLILSAKSTLTPAALTAAIQQNTDDIGLPGFDNYFGWGRVNAYKAVLAVWPAAAGGASSAP